jgi:hypothetical protein
MASMGRGTTTMRTGMGMDHKYGGQGNNEDRTTVEGGGNEEQGPRDVLDIS